MKTSGKILLLATGLFAATQIALAQTWTQTSAPITNWTTVACSANGTKLVAAANGGVGPGPSYIVAPGQIYISTNFGSTWIQATNAPVLDWRSVACSADGNKLVAVAYGDGIYRSIDGGLTWTATSALKTNWVSVASSADGDSLAALAEVFPSFDFYTSSDSGNTWSAKDSPYDRWVAIASSADGNTLAACGPGTILASTNSGNSWTTNVSAGPTFPTFFSVASSANGTRLVVAGAEARNGEIYHSTNSGFTWTPIEAPPIRRIASSADGSKLVAAAYVGPIYASTNFGLTWMTNLPSGTNYWASVASSADGSKLVAVANGGGGGIWTAQVTSMLQLNVKTSNTNLHISWVVPSIDFVLQENSDLATTNWTDLTNRAVLNLTNLHDEVTLPLTNDSGFYRLKTP